jgi:hypothetical protein
VTQIYLRALEWGKIVMNNQAGLQSYFWMVRLSLWNAQKTIALERGR